MRIDGSLEIPLAALSTSEDRKKVEVDEELGATIGAACMAGAAAAVKSLPASPWRPAVERRAAVADAITAPTCATPEFEAKSTPTLERALPSTRGTATSCAGCADLLQEPKVGAMTLGTRWPPASFMADFIAAQAPASTSAIGLTRSECSLLLKSV